jgi:hypothetical protein
LQKGKIITLSATPILFIFEYAIAYPVAAIINYPITVNAIHVIAIFSKVRSLAIAQKIT